MTAISTLELADARAEIERLRKVNQNLVMLLGHELRSPLTFILASLYLWEENHTAVDSEELQLVVEEALNLKTRLEDLLLLDQLEAGSWCGRPSDVYLPELIQRAIDKQRSALVGKKLLVQVHVDNPREPLWVDQDLLCGALDHLLSNACKFSPHGGVVELRAVRRAESWEISVGDNGIGLTREQQRHIFEPFYQADSSLRRRYGGLGLGLKLVKASVDILGGEVGVESNVGTGSRFTITLPAEPCLFAREEEFGDENPRYESVIAISSAC